MATRTEMPRQVVTEEMVKEFVLTLNYEDESPEFSKEDFPNAAHLITPTTDLVLLNFLIKKQREGLHLSFIDVATFQTVTVDDFQSLYDSNIAKLMYPGYEQIYRHDFTGLSPYINDYIETQYMIDDIMTHFGRIVEYNLSAKDIYTIHEITKFINFPTIVEGTSGGLNFNLFKHSGVIIFLTVFTIYWIATGIQTAFIAGSLAVIAYWIFKSYKQFKKDIG